MAEPVVCPDCQHAFRVSDDVRLAWLTCPRCFAVIPNPGVGSELPPRGSPPSAADEPTPVPQIQGDPSGETYPAKPPPAVPRLPRLVPEGIRRAPPTCPACGKPTQPQWLTCAHCEEPLQAPDGSIGARGPEHSRRTGSLAAIGVLGIVLALLMGVGQLASGNFIPLACVVGFLVLLAGVSTVFVVVRNDGDVGARDIGRIFFNTLALGGGFVSIGCLLLIAAAVFGFVVCLANTPRGGC